MQKAAPVYYPQAYQGPGSQLLAVSKETGHQQSHLAEEPQGKKLKWKVTPLPHQNLYVLLSAPPSPQQKGVPRGRDAEGSQHRAGREQAGRKGA